MKILRIFLILTALSIVFAATASAHDVWFVPDGENYRLVYGHPGEPEPYEPAKAKSVTGINKDGARGKIKTHVHNEQLFAEFPGGLSLVITDFDNGFWTEDQNEKYFNVSKREVPNYKASMHSMKFNKMIVSWSQTAGKPVGADFEILPLKDPLALKPGELLPVQLLYKSKPLSGAEIEILGDETLHKTDADGKASLPISADSFQYILARHKETLKNHPDADTLALETNLTFFR